MTHATRTAPLLLVHELPEFTRAAVRFLARFYPDTSVIVLDGSDTAASTRDGLGEAAQTLAIDHRIFPADMPPAHMLRAVLADLDDPVVLLGPAEAFPLMPILRKAEAALAQDASAVSAVTAAIEIRAPAPGEIAATLHIGRPLPQPSADLRMGNFARWPVATRHGAIRRAHLLRQLDDGPATTVPQLAAFANGLKDAAHGSIGLVPEVGFLLVPHTVPAIPMLDVFESAAAILALVEAVQADLIGHAGMDDNEDTASLADALVRWGVAEAIGAPACWQRGFDTARPYLNGTVDRQFETFEALLRDGTPVRRAFAPQLAFAVEAARLTACPPRPVPQHSAPVSPGRSMRSTTRKLNPETLCMAPDAPTLHILGLGGASVASHGEGPSQSAFGVVLRDGTRHPLTDPLPGGTGNGGSVWPRLAERLARDGLAGELLVSLCASDGIAIADWAEGGTQHTALAAALPALAAAPHPPQLIVWHQDEHAVPVTTADYCAAFGSLFALVQRHLPGAIWLICRASLRDDGASAAVIAAQEGIIDTNPMCLPGPNTAILTGRHRSDGAHLSAEGLDAFAEMLVDMVALALR